MSDTTLYDMDIVAWADEQAAAMRDLARVRPDLSNVLDWENIAEELEGLSRTELRNVRSPLRNVFVHILKGYCDPDTLSMHQWARETNNWLTDIRDDFTNSMRQKIDLDDIWQKAGGLAADELSSYKVAMPPALSSHCPFSLDQILDDTFTFDTACRALHRIVAERR